MTYRKLTRQLKQLGCQFVRQGKGSHTIWINPENGKKTTIPDWGSQDLSKGTLQKILKDLGVSLSLLLLSSSMF